MNTNALPSPKLSSSQLIICAILLAISNFIVVLDMTVANVSVPHIAGGLAVSVFEGTYVITSYAVAEAITVPLTGWLALRFGTLRVFSWGIILFGVFSAMCGLSHTLDFLVVSRVLQGLAGGPIMPLSQTLLLRIFPQNKQAAAIGIWGTTTLIAPILGPIVGGYVCDNWAWPFIFYLNIPVVVICSLIIGKTLAPFETQTQKRKIDYIGLILLIVWVAALQLMLDEGKNHDWFESSFIVSLFIIFLIGFAAFLIWELTADHPIVDIRVFKHRGFSMCVFTICLTFGAFFGSIVLTPLWLQNIMQYTATWSGYTTAMIGIFAVFVAPLVAQLTMKFDSRYLVFGGVMWIGILTFTRSFNTTDMTYTQIAIPILIQGLGMPFFFLPLTGLALSSVAPHETASAAGLMNFIRTLSGAFATSIITTNWDNQASYYRSELVGLISPEKVKFPLEYLDGLVNVQSLTLSMNYIFQVSSLFIFFAAAVVWLVPKPKGTINPSVGH